jgi:hypothetical protein
MIISREMREKAEKIANMDFSEKKQDNSWYGKRLRAEIRQAEADHAESRAMNDYLENE